MTSVILGLLFGVVIVVIIMWTINFFTIKKTADSMTVAIHDLYGKNPEFTSWINSCLLHLKEEWPRKNSHDFIDMIATEIVLAGSYPMDPEREWGSASAFEMAQHIIETYGNKS
jgi:hypothetical protein